MNMSHTTSRSGTSIPRQARSQSLQSTEMTGWVGWIGFASIMMMLLGAFHLFAGLIALFQDQYYQVGRSGLTVHVSYTTWGWVHIIGGVLIVAAGIGLFAGRLWARSIAVVLAMLSAVVNVGFLAADPVWSVIMITINILVIWAVTVHGSELKD
jgi:vacuolar-type H+-ATPase subunit I/STV1